MTQESSHYMQPFASGVVAPKAERDSLLERMKKDQVRFLRLMFSDIMGRIKNVEVPESQFAKALRGEIMFDGSSIQGFTRIEESDMLLVPDLESYVIIPFEGRHGKVARLICDIYNSDRTPFDGCPRLTLKRAISRLAAEGLHPVCGPELEFFLFQKDAEGNPTVRTHDAGGYFDLLPVDLGEDARRRMVNVLEQMGFEIEAAHHEVAPGQHEIDFRYAAALRSADQVMTFKLVIKKIALDFGLHATFMPKPIFGVNGSGMHTHQSLFRDNPESGDNAFYDPESRWELSDLARHYIGGILEHARAFVALTNPQVNSYKRLVPGYEAPVNVAWSEHNRSPLARVPERRGVGTRVEVRVPDPSCNPYLAFAAMLMSGYDGIANGTEPGEPVNKNIFDMSQREKGRLKITQLPGNLIESVGVLRKSALMREIMGDHIFNQYIAAKQEEWDEYISQVHGWELRRYLATT